MKDLKSGGILFLYDPFYPDQWSHSDYRKGEVLGITLRKCRGCYQCRLHIGAVPDQLRLRSSTVEGTGKRPIDALRTVWRCLHPDIQSKWGWVGSSFAKRRP